MKICCWGGVNLYFDPFLWGFKILRRAKLQAEVYIYIYIYIYAIQGSVGSGDKLRALLCGLTGNFESVKDPGLV